jgi:tetratricopeptide (TPR) repeat protein
VPRQLPAAPTPFTGRDREVAWLHATTGDRGATAVISGTAGVGKTALALHWAHRVRHRFPDGQLYVDLRGYDPERPVAPEDALVRLLGALGVAEEDLPPRAEDRAARWRTETSDRHLLLVLDNAASAAHVRPLLPGTPSCAVVVTSRDRLAGLVAVEGACRLELDLFPPVDAVALLRRLIGDRAVADPGATEVLAEQCARLPLALRIAAELAALRVGVPVADLVAELSDRQRRLDLLRAGDDAREAVEGVLSWSYHHLPVAARRVFRLLGLHPDTAFTDDAVAALAGTTADRARDLVDLLARAHLVQRTGPNRATTHDLLRAYARRTTEAEDSGSDRRAALTRLFDHYLATASAAMDAVHPAERHHRPAVPAAPAPFADVDSALAWLDAERPAMLAVCGHAAAHGWPRRATALAATLYRYLESGHYTDALSVHGHAAHAARCSGDRHAEAVANTNLGAVHRLLGHYDVAGGHLRQALDVFRALGDRRGEARVRSNLGILDDRTGRHGSAAEHCEEALRLYRALGDSWGEASALTNLGAVEEELGLPERAADHLRQALERYRELGDRWGEAVAATNLGDLCTRLGRPRAAEDHLNRAVTAFHALGHRYGEAVALSNLGALAARTGRPDLAARQHEQALELYRELGHRYGEATALNGLGELRTRAGDPAGAVGHHEAALAITADTGDRDEAARAHSGLARAHDLAGNADRALHHRRLALSLSDGALGGEEGEPTGAQ